MAQAVLSVRMDRTDKENFDEFCHAAGMNASVAVNMFVKAVLKSQRIPFDLTGDPFYSPANLRHLRHSIAQAEAGQLESHPLLEVEDE